MGVALLALSTYEAQAADSRVIAFHRPGNMAPQSKAGQRILGPGGATKMRAVLDETGPVPQFSPISIASDGFLTATLVTNAAGCAGTPSVTVTVDTVEVDWGTACVLPGDCVTLQFGTTKGPLALRRSYFTNGLGDSIAPATPNAVPGVSPFGAGALTALLALAGALVLARRRKARTEA